jgi:hypothetical protein
MSFRLKRIVSFVFLLVFSIYITPKEIYHVFTHHIDTEHSLELNHGLQISNQHHHCELLKVDQHFTSSDVTIPFYEFYHTITFYEVKNLCNSLSYILQGSYNTSPLRGPPTV